MLFTTYSTLKLNDRNIWITVCAATLLRAPISSINVNTCVNELYEIVLATGTRAQMLARSPCKSNAWYEWFEINAKNSFGKHSKSHMQIWQINAHVMKEKKQNELKSHKCAITYKYKSFSRINHKFGFGWVFTQFHRKFHMNERANK